jgi:hypothetical protein
MQRSDMQGRPRATRVLLSEGSSLSAREAVSTLGLAGYRLHIASSDTNCLCRFSRFVDRVHAAPASGKNPEAYLNAVLDIVEREHIDILLPVHEQAYLFAAARHRLPVGLGIAVADFAAFQQVQSKAAFSTLLSQLGIPQPPTRIAFSSDEFTGATDFPCYAKTAFGNASAGVWRLENAAEAAALSQDLARLGAFAHGVLIQLAAAGALERTQTVFDRGRLVACHSYRQIEAGPGGGDVVKRSIVRHDIRAFAARIGAALAWHGALSFDTIADAATNTPLFIDANPRLVEPMNAWLSGVDLAGAMISLSLGETPPEQPPGREGVVSCLGLMGLMDAAQRRGRRMDVVREAFALITGTGRYRGAAEELVPIVQDWQCAMPLAAVMATLLSSPKDGANLSRRTVEAYSLSAQAIETLQSWQG